MDERERYGKGLEVRRGVLGDAHVDRTLKTKTSFNDEFQDLITRYAWGEIWTRPGLPKHTRSIATLAMLVALNRPDELKLHLRASWLRKCSPRWMPASRNLVRIYHHEDTKTRRKAKTDRIKVGPL